ncbi:MAG: HD domain-containing protein [candidate division Zixibacteria bacterium]|nr:HD domain-containing protein [candidate division Zixibacteria bacterium]
MSKLTQDTVNEILKYGKIYEVGGTVRDKYMDRTPVSKDYDYLVTGISYEKLTNILKEYGKLNLVGQSFGVIKFTQFIDGKPHTFDIALPRTEYSIGSGHKEFDVVFNPSISVEEDLRRRDFTVNAMALDLSGGVLIDPLGGINDLNKKSIKIVYPDSFKDDPLRMLRAVQFVARFGFEIEADTFESMKTYASLITTVSPERIAEELNKLLELSDKPSIGFRLMEKSGLLNEILPELVNCIGVEQPGTYHAYDVYEHTLRIIDECPKDIGLRLAALFHDINKPQCKRIVDKGASFYGHDTFGARTAKRVLNRLRYSNELIRKVEILIERHMFPTDVTDKGLRRLIRKTTVEFIFDLLELRRADTIAQGTGLSNEDVDIFEKRVRDELEKKPPFGFSDLALNGNDLMELYQLSEGPLIGEVLNYLMEKVLDYPEDNTKNKLIEYTDEFINNKNDKG